MNDKKFIIVAAFGCFILLFGAYFVFSSGTPTPQVPIITYKTTDKVKPVALIKKDSASFGTINVNDEKSEDFSLENTGKKPLQILNISTSCMCTIGQIIYDNKTSDEYGMHSQGTYVTEIAPGGKATIRLTYRPYLMPVNGYVEREVYVATNDPLHQKLIFKVTANVQ